MGQQSDDGEHEDCPKPPGSRDVKSGRRTGYRPCAHAIDSATAGGMSTYLTPGLHLPGGRDVQSGHQTVMHARPPASRYACGASICAAGMAAPQAYKNVMWRSAKKPVCAAANTFRRIVAQLFEHAVNITGAHEMGMITDIKRFTGIGELRIVNPFAFRIGQNRRILRHRGTSADKNVIRQMFQYEDYSFSHLRRGAELTEMYDVLERPLIIDAGANIGASVCWFQKNFPRAHIVAFEPEDHNFELLRANTSDLNVDLHHSAVGATEGTVALVDPGQGEWGYQTRDDKNADVKRESLARIIASKIAEGFVPFIAKIDIEGGEDDLFSANTDWVDQFPVIIIELHDWLLPKRGTSQNFLRCIANRNRDFVHIGENIFSIQILSH